MNESSELIYTHQGILPPHIVKVVGLVLFPVIAIATILIFLAAFYTQQWWVLLLGLGFFVLSLMPIMGMNSVEVWNSDKQLVYKENPFNFYPPKPIPISDILYVEIVPQFLRHRTSYGIVILTNAGKVSLASTNSHDEAIEITQIIERKLAAFHLSTGNI